VKVYDPFYFSEPTVTGIRHLGMLENDLMPQLQQDMDRDFTFNKMGHPRVTVARLLLTSNVRRLLGLDIVER
jgi:hypothetical protein